MLLNIFPCTGQTPQQRILQPEMSVVPRLRIPGWVPGVSEHVRVRMCVFPPLHLENETYTGYSSSDPYGGVCAHLHPSPGVGYRNIQIKAGL